MSLQAILVQKMAKLEILRFVTYCLRQEGEKELVCPMFLRLKPLCSSSSDFINTKNPS